VLPPLVVLTDRTTVGTARHPLPKKFHTGTGIPHPVDESVRIENRKVKNGHAVWNAAFNGVILERMAAVALMLRKGAKH
jgi:hypothetical protein